ncbi:MAG: DUF5752 family protein [Thermoprotei archaeon]|jgi:hypothetical protein
MVKKIISYESILRKVDDEKAFYFYNDINAYTGIKANSLEEFAGVLPTLSVNVIDFHLKRGDFEKWVRDVLGDETLSKNISKVREKGFVGDDAKRELVKVISRRLKDLQKRVVKVSS